MNNQFWSFILPIIVFMIWLVFGAGVAYYYWLQNDNKRAWKWLYYSLLILGVISLIGWIWHGIKTGRWFLY